MHSVKRIVTDNYKVIPNQLLNQLQIDYFNTYNLIILGNVSAGKSTFVNVLFQKTVAQTHMLRTTMLPITYIVSQKQDLNNEQILKRVSTLNEDLLKQPELITADYLSQNRQYIQVKSDLLNDLNIQDQTNQNNNQFKLHITDMPGLNDSKTSQQYYEYLKYCFDNLHLPQNRFGVYAIILDVNQGVNTKESIELIDFLAKQFQIQKDYKATILVIINKCDEMVYDQKNNKLEIQSKQLREMQQQIIKQYTQTCKDIPNIKLIFQIASTRQMMQFRATDLKTLQEQDINIKEVLIQQYSLREINKMSPQEKAKKYLEIIKSSTNDDNFICNGLKEIFEILKYTITPQEIIEFISNSIQQSLKRIEVEPFYTQLNQEKKLVALQMYTQLSSEIQKSLSLLFQDNKQQLSHQQKQVNLVMNIISQRKDKKELPVFKLIQLKIQQLICSYEVNLINQEINKNNIQLFNQKKYTFQELVYGIQRIASGFMDFGNQIVQKLAQIDESKDETILREVEKSLQQDWKDYKTQFIKNIDLIKELKKDSLSSTKTKNITYLMINKLIQTWKIRQINDKDMMVSIEFLAQEIHVDVSNLIQSYLGLTIDYQTPMQFQKSIQQKMLPPQELNNQISQSQQNDFSKSDYLYNYYYGAKQFLKNQKIVNEHLKIQLQINYFDVMQKFNLSQEQSSQKQLKAIIYMLDIYEEFEFYLKNI